MILMFWVMGLVQFQEWALCRIKRRFGNVTDREDLEEEQSENTAIHPNGTLLLGWGAGNTDDADDNQEDEEEMDEYVDMLEEYLVQGTDFMIMELVSTTQHNLMMRNLDPS